jgi:hypothetical protein
MNLRLKKMDANSATATIISALPAYRWATSTKDQLQLRDWSPKATVDFVKTPNLLHSTQISHIIELISV